MTDSEVMAAALAMLEDREQGYRERAISSLRLFADPADYDLMLSAGDMGGAELDAWDMTL